LLDELDGVGPRIKGDGAEMFGDSAQGDVHKKFRRKMTETGR
jgi:hypothetical protein